MKVTRWFILSVLVMYKNLFTRGFLLDESTPASQLIGGSVITDQHFLTLIELLSDEKQHRYQLEQKVAELEKRQGSVNQDSKMSQMESYIKKLDSRISSVEQITASPVNNTCSCPADSEAIQTLFKRTMDIELKLSALETKNNALYHARNETDQRLNELQQEVGDLRNLKTVNQLQTVNSLTNEVRTLNLKTSQLESSSQARSQDFLALYRSTQTTVNYVTNNTLSIGQIHKYMNMSELISKEKLDMTEKSLKKLEDRQNQTDKSLSQFYDTCNKTDQRLNQLQQEVVELSNLWNETRLQTFNSLQKEVPILISKFQQLESISQARSQDLLALYMKTETTEHHVTNNTLSISQIQNNMNQSESIAKERYSTTENSLKKLEDGQNHTYTYLHQLELRNNVTYSGLFSKINNESEKVMVTACCTTPNVYYNKDQVIKYDIIRTSTGISDSARLLSSGVFICEKPGLYIVMVLMRGISSYSYYWIKKNNTNMLFIQNMYSKDIADRSVSGSFAIDLDIGDTIYVMPGNDVKLNAESCLSVIKVK